MKSNVLLQGDIGVGKTTSLRTLLPEWTDDDGVVHKGCGQRVALLSYEPGAEAALKSNLCHSADSFGIHLHYIRPLDISWTDFRRYAQVLNSMTLDKALDVGDTNKRACQQFLETMNVLCDFVCDRCGVSLGDPGEWGEDWTLALDGLTGLTTVARHNCVGLKPILSRPEYNPIMEMVEGFLKLFWGGTKCNAILLSHIDRETDPLTGMSKITAHTIGQKLAPRIVKVPDEIIQAEYAEGKFTWNTEMPGQVLKTRRMPKGIGFSPTFAHIFKDTAA